MGWAGAIGQIFSSIASGVQSIFVGRQQKTLFDRSIRAQAFATQTQYENNVSLLQQEAQLQREAQDFELKKIEAQRQALEPFLNQKTTPDKDYFEQIQETIGFNPLYILGGLVLFIILISISKKKHGK